MMDVKSMSRPIKKVYINFDKDIAHKMFGYRVRFVKENMSTYMQTGTPSPYASQGHKPIHFFQKDRLKGILDRYHKFEGYHSKQTIVRILDSDNEEDAIEIEKNRK